MRGLLLLVMPGVMLGALSGGTPPQAPAERPAVVTLAPDSESRWVPFELTPGNQIRFTAMLDGRPAVAILDTGASHSLVSRGSPLVDAARLRPGGRATAIGGEIAIEWMATERLSVGGLTRTGGDVAITALPAIATGSAAAVDLVVGADLTRGQALDIDYPGKRFRLLASGRLPFTGVSAPLTVSAERDVYESAIAIDGRVAQPMLVDTGDGAAVTLAADDWARLRPAGLATTSVIAFGVAGELVSELAIVPQVTLGTLVAHEVEVRVEPAGGFSATMRAAGRIGSAFLQRYRVLLDPAAGRMVLSPGPGADRPPLRSTSGLLVGVLRDRLRVLHVMRGGPAAADGWKAGDTICTIDGTPVPADYPTSPLARWSAAPPGTRVRLGDCAGHERMLTTQRFY